MKAAYITTLAVALISLAACSPSPTQQAAQPIIYINHATQAELNPPTEQEEQTIPADWIDTPLAGVVYEPIGE